MTAASDAKAAATALRLIQSAGQSLAIKKQTAANYNVATGKAAPTESSGNIDAVVLPLNSKSTSDFANEISQAGDKRHMRKLLIAGSSAPFDIEGGETVTFESADWEIIGAHPLAPAGSGKIIYTAVMAR